MEANKFTPSKYQQDIFDYILNDTGNLVIEAVAGAGKSTTILKSMDYISSDKKVLFLAFANKNAEELKERTKSIKNAVVKTTYSMGRVIVDNALNKPELNKEKYFKEFIENTSSYTTNSKYMFKKHKWNVYLSNINKLLIHARQNLCSTIGDIKKIANEYEINIVADEMSVVKKLIAWGKRHIKTVDFVDMVWFPVIFDLPSDYFTHFDFVFIDEAQDLSKCQRELILKYRNEKTRFVFVGDSKQAIYGFNSADPKSFEELKKIPNTKLLPLSVCYRCPKKIISFVKHIVPQIEPAENAIEGSVSFDKSLKDINDGDTVLCRNNAPLFQIFASFARMGKKAFIVGDDFEDSLKELIENNYHDEINANLNEIGLMSELYRFYFKKRKDLMDGNGYEATMCDNMPDMIALIDKIGVIKVLCEGINNTTELINRLDRLFNTEKEGIRLITAHKAKGAEYPNVFIAKPELFDATKKNMEWEKVQEQNLEYVAYTRAMRNLSFIKSSEIKNTFSKPLSEIERTLNELYDPARKTHMPTLMSHDTITGITTPGINILYTDDKPPYSKTTTQPLVEIFSKKKKRKLF